MAENQLTPEQWGIRFTLLSLDRVVPLYEAMGLRLTNKSEFVRLLRRSIIENREAYVADPTAPPPLARKFLRVLDQTFGTPEVQHFETWATTVFYEVHADLPQWSAWQVAFLYIAPPLRGNGPARPEWEEWALPLPKREVIAARHRAAADTSQLDQYIASLKSQPLSEWDLEMYTLHEFNPGDPNDPTDVLGDPLTTVSSVAEMNAFQIFWESMLPMLDDTELNALWHIALRKIGELEIWMDEPLKHPKEMRRQLR